MQKSAAPFYHYRGYAATRKEDMRKTVLLLIGLLTVTFLFACGKKEVKVQSQESKTAEGLRKPGAFVYSQVGGNRADQRNVERVVEKQMDCSR